VLRRIVPVIFIVALLVCSAFASAAAADGPTATAARVQAKAAKAAKSCKKATARAAKATTPVKRKQLVKTKKKACKKAQVLARSLLPTVDGEAKGDTATASADSARRSPLATNNAPGNGYIVGVDANARSYSDPGDQYDRVAQAGVSWSREELEWNSVEPTEGHLDWSRYDTVFAAAAERGLHILPLVGGIPSWAAPSWNWVPENPAQYAAFVAKVAKRYGPGGSFWTAHPQLDASLAVTYIELYNEPYYDYFSANGIDPARYANLAIAAADAGRAANPGTKYLASSADMDNTGHDWTRGMFAARPDLADHVDGFAIHPYSKDLTTYGAPQADSFRRDLEQTQAALAENGAADKPIWITEMGWSTCTTSSDCVTEQQQEDLTRQLGEVLDTTYSGSVRALFLFNFTEGDPADTGVQAHFGLTRQDGSHKPAYDALRDLAATHD
jgi:hypothetical protein